MKKLLALILLATLFVSCSSNDDDDPMPVTDPDKISLYIDNNESSKELNIKIGEKKIIRVIANGKGYLFPNNYVWTTSNNNIKIIINREGKNDIRLIEGINPGESKIYVKLDGTSLKDSCIVNTSFANNTQRAYYEISKVVKEKNGHNLNQIKAVNSGNKPKNIFFNAIIDNKLWVCSYDTINYKITKEWIGSDKLDSEKTINIGYGEQLVIKPKFYKASNICENNGIFSFLLDFFEEEKEDAFGFQNLYFINGEKLNLINQTEPIKNDTHNPSRIINWLDGFQVFQFTGILNNSSLCFYKNNGSLVFNSKCGTYSSSSIISDFLWDETKTLPISDHIGLNCDYYTGPNNPNFLIRRFNLKNMELESKFIYFKDLVSGTKLQKLETNIKINIVEFKFDFILFDGSKISKTLEFNPDTFEHKFTE